MLGTFCIIFEENTVYRLTRGVMGYQGCHDTTRNENTVGIVVILCLLPRQARQAYRRPAHNA